MISSNAQVLKERTVQLPKSSPSVRVGLSLLPLLATAGILLAAEAPAARAKVVVTNPSSLDDAQFRCLLGVEPGCTTTQVEENWVVEADGRGIPNGFTRINEWTSNSTFTARDEQKQAFPYGTPVPFFVDYIKDTEEVVFRLDFGSPIGTKESTFSPLTRSSAINSLYFRVASGSNSTAFRTELTDLLLTTSPDTPDAHTFAIGDLTARGLASGREVNYAVVTGLPDSNFRITGNALFDSSDPVKDRAGNWQIKAAYTVPGPLPILAGAAAFGWSRRLRRLTRR